jgi:hypothetical protein
MKGPIRMNRPLASWLLTLGAVLAIAGCAGFQPGAPIVNSGDLPGATATAEPTRSTDSATPDAEASPSAFETPPSSNPVATGGKNCYGINESVDTPPNTIASVMTVTDSVVVGVVTRIEEGIFNTPSGAAPDPSRKPGPGYSPGVVTPIDLDITSVLAGDDQRDPLRVVNPGGTAGCVVHTVSNAARVTKGGTYVFFLQPSRDSNGEARPDLPLILVAWPVDADGNVRTEEDGTLTMEELRARIAKA